MTMNSPSTIDRLEVVDRMRAVAIDLVDVLELNARHAFASSSIGGGSLYAST